jgi:hypothetical protein
LHAFDCKQILGSSSVANLTHARIFRPSETTMFGIVNEITQESCTRRFCQYKLTITTVSRSQNCLCGLSSRFNLLQIKQLLMYKLLKTLQLEIESTITWQMMCFEFVDLSRHFIVAFELT